MDLVTVLTPTHVSTTAVSYSIATSSSESLPNDGEKPNQLKRLLFLKCDYGRIKFPSVKLAFTLGPDQQKWYSLIYTVRMVILGKLVDSVSIYPVLSAIKLFSEVICNCQEMVVMRM